MSISIKQIKKPFYCAFIAGQIKKKVKSKTVSLLKLGKKRENWWSFFSIYNLEKKSKKKEWEKFELKNGFSSGYSVYPMSVFYERLLVFYVKSTKKTN